MEQLVDQHAGQLDAVELEQIGQERVVEKSEARERDRWPHHRVETLRFERRGFRIRIALVEIAAIRHAANYRKPPGVGLQRVARRRHQDVDDRALIDGRNSFIRTADVLAQFFGSELAHREDSLELGANVRRKILARQHVVDRFTVP